jgi:predicted nucleic acid-binding protein
MWNRRSHPNQAKSILALCQQHGLTVYDAAYLELSKRKGLPLATQDSDLLKAAQLEGALLIARP